MEKGHPPCSGTSLAGSSPHGPQPNQQPLGMSPPALRGSEQPDPGPLGATIGVRPEPPAQGHPDRRADDATRGSPAAGTSLPPTRPRCPRARQYRGGTGLRSPTPQPRPRHRCQSPEPAGVSLWQRMLRYRGVEGGWAAHLSVLLSACPSARPCVGGGSWACV